MPVCSSSSTPFGRRRDQLGRRRLRLTDDQRRTPPVRAKALGGTALNGLVCIVTHDTLNLWYRELFTAPARRRHAGAFDPMSRA